jgi:hypothetical protein
MRCREDVELGVLGEDLAGHRVQRHQPLHFVTEELDAHGVFLVHREHLHGVPPHSERPPGERQIVACVLDLHKPAQHGVPVDLITDAQTHHPVHILLRRSQTIYGTHRRHHDHVAAGEQAVRGTVPQPLNLLVDRRVLLDEGVRLWDVRLRLVVVVVADEVLDRVVGHEFAELVGQLCRQRLVGGHHQRRPLELLHDPCGGRALAGTGGAEKHDVLCTFLDPAADLLDRSGLVAGGLVVAHHPERGYRALQVGDGSGHDAYATSRVRRGRDTPVSHAQDPLDGVRLVG